MGNAQGHHGDHLRKHSGYQGGTEGLTFGDKPNHGREMSPFDPVSCFKTSFYVYINDMYVICMYLYTETGMF